MCCRHQRPNGDRRCDRPPKQSCRRHLGWREPWRRQSPVQVTFCRAWTVGAGRVPGGDRTTRIVGVEGTADPLLADRTDDHEHPRSPVPRRWAPAVGMDRPWRATAGRVEPASTTKLAALADLRAEVPVGMVECPPRPNLLDLPGHAELSHPPPGQLVRDRCPDQLVTRRCARVRGRDVGASRGPGPPWCAPRRSRFSAMASGRLEEVFAGPADAFRSRRHRARRHGLKHSPAA